MWAVTVCLDGETLITIASDYVCGKPAFTEAEETIIRDAARNLQAFIGDEKSHEDEETEGGS